MARIQEIEGIAEGDRVVRFVARIAGLPVGSVALSICPPDGAALAGAWLMGLRVHPVFRRMGLGTKLCREVLRAAAMAGEKSVYLTVGADNSAAIFLYQQLGFYAFPEGAAQSEAHRLSMLTGKPYLAMRITLSEPRAPASAQERPED